MTIRDLNVGSINPSAFPRNSASTGTLPSGPSKQGCADSKGGGLVQIPPIPGGPEYIPAPADSGTPE